MLAASAVLALGGAGYSAYRWYTSPSIPPAPPLPLSIPPRRIETTISTPAVSPQPQLPKPLVRDSVKKDMLDELTEKLKKRREYEMVTTKDLE
jgi:hypothetical protein